MNWQQLKEKVYKVDGGFRDIYVLNTTKKDWQVWVDYVTANYKTSFRVHETDETFDRIDFSILNGYWNGMVENASIASVFLDNIQLNAHFFEEETIETDITPGEINSMEDHQRVLDFMTGLSNALGKKVILTPEWDPEIVLISVENGQVKITS
jgi:hypothetical protein